MQDCGKGGLRSEEIAHVSEREICKPRPFISEPYLINRFQAVVMCAIVGCGNRSDRNYSGKVVKHFCVSLAISSWLRSEEIARVSAREIF